MLIRINYTDGRFDMVKASRLNYLIKTGQVSRFKRNNGWVAIDRDAVRDKSNEVLYCGPERRDTETAGLL